MGNFCLSLPRNQTVLLARGAPGACHCRRDSAQRGSRHQLSSVRHPSLMTAELYYSHTARSRRSSQPAIWLGLGLIGGGLSLYQLRRVQPVLSRDFDVVVSSVVIFSGGILVFQLLTAGTALAWALEAIKLRKLVENEQKFDERARQFQPPLEDQMQTGSPLRGIPLPAPRESDFSQWYGPTAEDETTGMPMYYQDELGYDPPSSDDLQAGERNGEKAPMQEGSSPGTVVNSVESYYNKPQSVTEDVERFYDGRRQQPGAEDLADEEISGEIWEGSRYSNSEEDEYLWEPRQVDRWEDVQTWPTSSGQGSEEPVSEMEDERQQGSSMSQERPSLKESGREIRDTPRW